MKYAINVPPFTDSATVVVWARRAERSGWDGFFVWDHVQWLEGVAPLDPWVTLGAISQVTERVRLGTLVTPLSRRRPHLVAKQLATLDHLSGGRAVLGVGGEAKKGMNAPKLYKAWYEKPSVTVDIAGDDDANVDDGDESPF